MQTKIACLDNLVYELSKLPGVGEKSAFRLAYYILKNRSTYPTELMQSLKNLQDNIRVCPDCYSYTDLPLCAICSNPNRASESICVVEQTSDVMKMESAGSFKGKYHVLGGSISPLHGVSPDDLSLNQLQTRLQKSKGNEQPIKEVILALDADLEGDTTALYIAKLLQDEGVVVSRLAHGIPFGSDIDYIDYRTLGRAFENRVEV